MVVDLGGLSWGMDGWMVGWCYVGLFLRGGWDGWCWVGGYWWWARLRDGVEGGGGRGVEIGNEWVGGLKGVLCVCLCVGVTSHSCWW